MADPPTTTPPEGTPNPFRRRFDTLPEDEPTDPDLPHFPCPACMVDGRPISDCPVCLGKGVVTRDGLKKHRSTNPRPPPK